MKKLGISLALIMASESSLSYDIIFAEKGSDWGNMYPDHVAARVLNFSETSSIAPLKNRSVFALSSDLSKDNPWDQVYSVLIDSNTVGKQRIYINLPNECDKDGYLGKENKSDGLRILKVNGQNVKFSRYCNGSFEYITPQSEAGTEYVIGQLKKKTLVAVSVDTIDILFDATGFTQAWNDFGGDAL